MPCAAPSRYASRRRRSSRPSAPASSAAEAAVNSADQRWRAASSHTVRACRWSICSRAASWHYSAASSCGSPGRLDQAGARSSHWGTNLGWGHLRAKLCHPCSHVDRTWCLHTGQGGRFCTVAAPDRRSEAAPALRNSSQWRTCGRDEGQAAAPSTQTAPGCSRWAWLGRCPQQIAASASAACSIRSASDGSGAQVSAAWTGRHRRCRPAATRQPNPRRRHRPVVGPPAGRAAECAAATPGVGCGRNGAQYRNCGARERGCLLRLLIQIDQEPGVELGVAVRW